MEGTIDEPKYEITILEKNCLQVHVNSKSDPENFLIILSYVVLLSTRKELPPKMDPAVEKSVKKIQDGSLEDFIGELNISVKLQREIEESDPEKHYRIEVNFETDKEEKIPRPSKVKAYEQNDGSYRIYFPDDSAVEKAEKEVLTSLLKRKKDYLNLLSALFEGRVAPQIFSGTGNNNWRRLAKKLKRAVKCIALTPVLYLAEKQFFKDCKVILTATQNVRKKGKQLLR